MKAREGVSAGRALERGRKAVPRPVNGCSTDLQVLNPQDSVRSEWTATGGEGDVVGQGLGAARSRRIKGVWPFWWGAGSAGF